MKTIQALGRTFEVFEGQECREICDSAEVFADNVVLYRLPGSDITWGSLEEYWVGYGVTAADLDPRQMFEHLLYHLGHFSDSERLRFVRIILNRPSSTINGCLKNASQS